ncbi:hypothetical protein H310_00460 [Aphanomyces invadans]|uniref:Uncharacterized protein n=1 Tax=Aphanomyces invadans TaxID=157072 RepID=A0A024UUQ8_9STRA|nr:hypothetical protein H310_00460 [Aphanomyces invadans]ETW10074.1 hypothetical protein H310_00460 [Aphanomyces invadans]|eukprot:XP_008861485.1 hypothetical protein H310_00460 [Aphanomyces invadans]
MLPTAPVAVVGTRPCLVRCLLGCRGRPRTSHLAEPSDSSTKLRIENFGEAVTKGFNIVLYAKRAISPPVWCLPIQARKPVPSSKGVTDNRPQSSRSLYDLTVRQFRLLQEKLEKNAKARDGAPVVKVRPTSATQTYLSLDFLDPYGTHEDIYNADGPVKKRKVTPETRHCFR